MTNNLKYAVSGLLAMILLPFSMHSLAQPPTFSDCQAIEDRQTRYDCYDSLDAAMGVERESAPAVTRPPQASRAPESTAVPTQGNSQKQAQENDGPSLFSRIFRRGSDDEPAPEVQAATTSIPQTTPANGSRSPNATRVVDDADSEFEQIARVADLDQPALHVWVITLEDGQTWQQVTSKRYNLEKGDEVRIYPTRWGSNYRLSSEKAGGFIQVRRVR